MKLTRDNAQALLVDYQERLLPPMSDLNRLMERTALLLKGLAVYEIPILITRQYPKGLGDTVPEIKVLTPNAAVVDKLSFSVVQTPEVRDALLYERPNIIVAGIETSICILQSVLDLLDMGKNVFLVVDCLDGRRPFDCEIALKRMIQAGAIPITAEALLFELTVKAGSDEFKKISNLVTGRTK